MSRDLGFSDRVFGMGAGIFFISYVALQIPGAHAGRALECAADDCATMIAWGSLAGTTLTALVHTPGQLYFARFVLGAAEAGFFPGVIGLSEPLRLFYEDRAKAHEQLHGRQFHCHSFVGSQSARAGFLAQSGSPSQGWRSAVRPGGNAATSC